MKKPEKLIINLDDYGRTVIEDPEILFLIAGAKELMDLSNVTEVDAACGNNQSCTNTSC